MPSSGAKAGNNNVPIGDIRSGCYYTTGISLIEADPLQADRLIRLYVILSLLNSIAELNSEIFISSILTKLMPIGI